MLPQRPGEEEWGAGGDQRKKVGVGRAHRRLGSTISRRGTGSAVAYAWRRRPKLVWQGLSHVLPEWGPEKEEPRG
jgi:hypothetical protein